VNIFLTTELEQFINEKLASGIYTSASEIIQEGLLLLKERDELRRDIMLGVEHAWQGQGKRYVGGTELADEIKRRGRVHLEERRKGAD
jgi:antitoxin ParD1/3/4